MRHLVRVLALGLCAVVGLSAVAPVGAATMYTVQSLGSALLGHAIPDGPGLTTRLTLFSAILGVGAAAAPLTGGWLYGLAPSYPFRATGLAAAAGAVVLLVVLRTRASAKDAVAALTGAASGE
jgi:hypothetical protein